MPEEYESWIDAQIYSQRASSNIAFKDLIFPLEKTRHESVLDSMWKNINLVSFFIFIQKLSIAHRLEEL